MINFAPLAIASATTPSPELLWAAPFALLLLCIAALPLAAPGWWSKHYPWIPLPLGAIMAVAYTIAYDAGSRMLHTAQEYVAFIALIGSLFVVSGGIHIRLIGVFTPRQNLLLLAIGSVLANLVGTTGASVILIRPFLRGNQWRFAPFHAAFFIFIVSNCGGALTPIGDPPLFLGYLKGVPFAWVIEHLWYKWLIAIGLLLAMFYVLDVRHFHRQSERRQDVARLRDWLLIDGKSNFLFLALIIGAVLMGAYLSPQFIWIREVLMVGAAVGSYFSTPRRIHESNDFNFHPIREVAILFAGIFACMVPALDWLQVNSHTLGINTAGGFYWATGITSAVLDNAPSYLNFLTAAMGLEGFSINDRAHIMQWIAGHTPMLRSISIAAVFFGAATYIGNGPNFMVKSICDHAGVPTPSFVSFILKYTLPFLLPVLVLTYFLVR